jgi:hypothetical protein
MLEVLRKNVKFELFKRGATLQALYGRSTSKGDGNSGTDLKFVWNVLRPHLAWTSCLLANGSDHHEAHRARCLASFVPKLPLTLTSSPAQGMSRLSKTLAQTFVDNVVWGIYCMFHNFINSVTENYFKSNFIFDNMPNIFTSVLQF